MRRRIFVDTGAFMWTGLAWAALTSLTARIFALHNNVGLFMTRHIALALEARVARSALPPASAIGGIIVLGGSWTRIEAAIALSERYPDARVLLSGVGMREFELATKILHNSEKLISDSRARNTFENALFSRHIIGTAIEKQWVVVTSALHMPRALGAFQAVGLDVLTWPVHDTSRLPPRRLSRWVWHEVFGLAGYWALGRSSALVPGNRVVSDIVSSSQRSTSRTPRRCNCRIVCEYQR